MGGFDRLTAQEVQHRPRQHGQTQFGLERFLLGMQMLRPIAWRRRLFGDAWKRTASTRWPRRASRPCGRRHKRRDHGTPEISAGEPVNSTAYAVHHLGHATIVERIRRIVGCMVVGVAEERRICKHHGGEALLPVAPVI